MKIYPRLVNIEEGKESYELSIRNSAEDDRILLFKVRRSEQKMMEFTPKMGYVEPGQTTKVMLRLIDKSIPKTRLLVKLAVIKKSMLESEFEQSWNAASKRNGEVKKVIDIVNMNAPGAAEALSAHDKGAHTSQAHKRSTKQQMLHRVRSTDSDAMSDTSSLSMQQSVASAGYFSPSPSVTAASSPMHSEAGHHDAVSPYSPEERYAGHSGYFDEEVQSPAGGRQGRDQGLSYDEEADRDNYSIAESDAASAADYGNESLDMHSYSQSLSQSQQLQLQEATAALLLQQVPTARSQAVATPSPPAVSDTSDDLAASGGAASQQKALLEMLVKLAQTPNTATLLSQLLLSVGHNAANSNSNSNSNNPNSRSAVGTAPAQNQVASHTREREPAASNKAPATTAHHDRSKPAHDGWEVVTHNADSAPTAEQQSRFIEAEQAAFPSIRAAELEPQGSLQALSQAAPEAYPVVDLQDCSRLAALTSGEQRSRLRGGAADDTALVAESRGLGLRGAYLLELFGANVTNVNFADLVEQRMEQATTDKGKVVAIEVVSTALSDLSTTFGGIFATSKAVNTNISSASAQADPLNQLRTLRSAYLEDHLKHLTVNECPLMELDTSLNRFRYLTALNLSNNRIRSLTGPLDLPLLRSLDLTGNSLTSLDYLQLLVSLTTLLAGGNRIASLNLSVNMLVSLSKSLVTLDITANPVCDDQHYAQEVLHVLPRLRYFDSFDLQQMGKNYSYTYQAAGSSTCRAGSAPRQTASTKTGARLPELPEELRSVRSGGSSSTLSRADRRKEFERRLNTAVGLRQRNHRTRVPSSPVPAPASASAASSRPRSSSRQKSTPSASTHHSSRISTAASEQWDTPGANGSGSEGADEDDLEIQSVEDSIHQLSGSLRHGRAPAGSADTADRTSGGGGSALNPNIDLVPVVASTARPARSVSPSLLQHWAEAGAPICEVAAREALLNVPPIDEHSGLLEPTMSIKNRQMYYGVANRRQRFPMHDQDASYTTTYSTTTLGNSAMWRSHQRESSRSPSSSQQRGYYSDGEVSDRRSRGRSGSVGSVHISGSGGGNESARRAATVVSLSEEQFLQMQEEEKYGQWHPRYRVPKPIFGFSRPFIHRRTPHLKDHAPLFNTTVQRLRDSFRKAPARGTFSRAGKGLPGEWYPMDWADLEAIRRQGYFHDTIGEVTKDSYRDAASSNQNRSMNADRSFASQQQPSLLPSGSTHVARFLQEALVSPKGSVSLSPDKRGRRQSWGPHMSRYDTAASVLHASDDFSGFRKWHQGLFDEGEGEQLSTSAPAGSSQQLDGSHGFERSAFSMADSAPSPVREGRDGTSGFQQATSVPTAPVSSSSAVQDADMQACFEGDEEEKRSEGLVLKEPVAAAAAFQEPHYSTSTTQASTSSMITQASKSLPLPELQFDHSPKDLGRASHGRERQVTLLPMEATDSGEMRASSALEDPYSPSTSFTQPQEQPLDASFVDELRLFEALPAFPAEIEASLSRYERQVHSRDTSGNTGTSGTNGASNFKQSDDLPAVIVLSPIKKSPVRSPAKSSNLTDVPAVAESLMDMSEQIAAEEAELSNYLSWLESQHRSTPAPAPVVAVPVPVVAVPRNPSPVPALNLKGGTAGSSRPSASPSGIPRYSQSPAQQRNKQASQPQPQSNQHSSSKFASGSQTHSHTLDAVPYNDEEELRVFSPRDAAMRAEQQERAETEERLFFAQGSSSSSHNSNSGNSKSSSAMRNLFR